MHHFLQLRNDSAYHHRFPTPPAKSPSRIHRTHHAHPHLYAAVLPRATKDNQRYGMSRTRHNRHQPAIRARIGSSNHRMTHSRHQPEKSGTMSNDVPDILIRIPTRTPARPPPNQPGWMHTCHLVEHTCCPPPNHPHTTNTPPTHLRRSGTSPASRIPPIAVGYKA